MNSSRSGRRERVLTEFTARRLKGFNFFATGNSRPDLMMDGAGDDIPMETHYRGGRLRGFFAHFAFVPAD
jgi:hypothetical protein